MITKQSHELLLVAEVEEILKTIESIEKEKATSKFAQRMIQALHDVLCTSVRFSREELTLIVKFTKERGLAMMQQDAESRIRNLSSN